MSSPAQIGHKFKWHSLLSIDFVFLPYVPYDAYIGSVMATSLIIATFMQ